MRADPNLYTSVNASIQQSEFSLQGAIKQLASGKRVSVPSDDPLAFAQDLRSLASSANVDRYTKNADTVAAQAQQADSSLSSVVTALTQAIALGTEGGNTSVSSTQRAGLAQQVRGLLNTVIAQANTTTNGVALFAGTAGTTTPFVADPVTPNSFIYQGNSQSNQVSVGDSSQVATNIPGDTIFSNASGNVLGSLQQMITALQTGTTSDLASANAGLTAAISHVGQVRATYGATVSALAAQTNFLSGETVALSSQQTSLTAVDTAAAATNLTQAETANSAVLAMAAKILPVSLLNYLH